MASVVIGDYRYRSYTNTTAAVQVVDTSKSSYGKILSSVEINGQTYEVVSMIECFYSCHNLTQAPEISPSITEITGCFMNCYSLTQAPEIPSSITKMANCFYGCSCLTQAPEIPSGVTNMSGCFRDCTALTRVPKIPPDVTTIESCFRNCTSLTQAPEIPSGVTNMRSCFQNCTSLTQAPEIPSGVTNMYLCFSGCSSLTQAPEIPSSVTDMLGCFQSCTSLTQAPEIPSSVTNMSGCFQNCTSLTQAPEIPSSVTDMLSCFQGCTSLTQAPEIPSSVTNMRNCFYNCINLTGNLVVHSRLNDNRSTSMFYNTIFPIYIINDTQPKSEEVSTYWREVANQYSNVHFEVDDHTSPKAILKLTRTDDSGEASQSGTYVKIEIDSEIYTDNIPVGWTAPTLTSERLAHDSDIEFTPVQTGRERGPYDLEDEEQHIIIYTINDGYKTTTVTATLSRVMALLDFLGIGGQDGYIDISGMGMAIGNIAKRNGLDIQFPTTIGKELLPPTTWAITLDTDVDPNKTYYELINNEYVEVSNPSGNPHEQDYYEKDAAVDLSNYQLAIGEYNKRDNDAIFIVGNGSDENNRSNTFIIKRNGNIKAQGWTGFIQMFAGSTAPDGWLFCDGSEVAIDDYPLLYAVIGDTYGTPSDSEHFLLPDLKDRFPVGAGSSYALNDKGGEATVTLNLSQIPSHDHGSAGAHTHQLGRNQDTVAKGTNYDRPNNASATTDRGYTSTSAGGHTHSANGGDQAHENMPPYIGLNFIICTGETS